MLTRKERTDNQADTFLLFGLLLATNPAIRADLDIYRARVRAAAPERVKIALSCARDGLAPSTAMKLLNQTIEQERTV